jgi:hypothetical protein
VLSKTEANDLQDVEKVLEPYRCAIEGLVVESTYNRNWQVDGLMEADPGP